MRQHVAGPDEWALERHEVSFQSGASLYLAGSWDRGLGKRPCRTM
jgi:hypothetical protein